MVNPDGTSGKMATDSGKTVKKGVCGNKFLFYVGLVSSIYHAVVHAGIVANINIPWWIGAIGVALSSVLMYCSGMGTSAVSASKANAGTANGIAYGADGTAYGSTNTSASGTAGTAYGSTNANTYGTANANAYGTDGRVSGMATGNAYGTSNEGIFGAQNALTPAGNEAAILMGDIYDMYDDAPSDNGGITGVMLPYEGEIGSRDDGAMDEEEREG